MAERSTEKPVDARVIKKTQDTLGKIVKKPPLTDKLLQKPPFRFLHDIVTSVSNFISFVWLVSHMYRTRQLSTADVGGKNLYQSILNVPNFAAQSVLYSKSHVLAQAQSC